MNNEVKTFREALLLVLHTWRAASAFFLSIELWLMVGVAAATVGGVWLAFMGDASSLLAFGLSIGYVVARTVLHVKRILNWPFI